MDCTEGFIHLNVHLNSEVSPAALLRKVRISVAFLVLFRCELQRKDNRCIDDCSITVDQALILQASSDGFQDRSLYQFDFHKRSLANRSLDSVSYGESYNLGPHGIQNDCRQ